MDKKSISSGIIGIIIGALLMGGIVYQLMPNLMIIEKESKFGFDKSVESLKEAVKNHGWKMPKIHDLQKTMAKFNKEVKKVKVFEICHPEHAYKILSKDGERIVSSLMPCRIAIYEHSDGKVYVSQMNTGFMGQMMNGIVPEVMEVASKESNEIISTILK